MDEIKCEVTEVTAQTVYALAVRSSDGASMWFTVGSRSDMNIEAHVVWWKSQGYDVRILTAELPL